MKATLFSSSISANLGNSEKKFTSTWSSNEEETNWPLQEVFTLQGERHCTYYQQQAGWEALSLIRQLRALYIIIHARTAHAQFYHVTVR